MLSITAVIKVLLYNRRKTCLSVLYLLQSSLVISVWISRTRSYEIHKPSLHISSVTSRFLDFAWIVERKQIGRGSSLFFVPYYS